MVKYLGPKARKIRYLGYIEGFYKKNKQYTNKTPGEHGIILKRKKNRSYISEDFKVELQKIQRIKMCFGIQSKKLKSLNKRSLKLQESISFLLKKRLDFIIFFLGLSKSIREARQKINHKKVSVNGFIISKPGYLCSSEDKIDLIV
jgi:small subunit ribosomal protein S4